MEDTIIPGDKIITTKFSYGSRLPSSPFEIPLVNLVFSVNKYYKGKADSVWWKYRRLKGLSKIVYNDVVVFNSPNNCYEILIKRCMGLPGDTLIIKNEHVLTNGIKIPERGSIRLLSRIEFNSNVINSFLIDSLESQDFNVFHRNKNQLTVSLNRSQINELTKYKCVDSIYIEKERPDTAWTKFPHNEKLFNWSLDDYGPVVVPKKGMSIILNEHSYILYLHSIVHFEHSEIQEIDNKYFINGVEATTYTFKNNYYFMLGDNRHESKDSRYIGFIPEQNIIGKAVMILFSDGNDGFKWQRFLKIIR